MNKNPSAYVVRFCIAGNPDAMCEQFFRERWRAEAFRDECTEVMDAKLIELYEQEGTGR